MAEDMQPEDWEEVAAKAAADEDYQKSITYSLMTLNYRLAGMAVPLIRVMKAQDRAHPMPDPSAPPDYETEGGGE